ncbi:sensor histidine kinase [Kitasatospora sp. NPDC056531]|uniref:sensor histidine kinase n=1 Tax=Kitasatospora sp. NPDC056531 TaxID=3345856 RepID=UPI0036AE4D8F
MDLHPLPVGQPGVGLLEAFVGHGFAAALQDGLSRRATPYRAPGRSGGAGCRQHAPRSGRGGEAEPARVGVLLLDGAGAVLRRFEERLHALAESDALPELNVPAVRAVLTAYARRILADARAIADGAAVAPTALGPALPCLAPELTTAVGTLLTECAVLHAVSGARAAVSAHDVPSLVRVLGQAIRRHCATSVDTGDAHDALWRERRRLAREMHDELGTHLSVALHHLALQARHDEDAAGHLAVAATGVRSALGHARDLITGLRDETAVLPLREAVESFVALAAPGGVRVTFSSTGNENIVPELWRRELFLAIRECLRNSFAHAQVDQIVVTGRVTRRWVHFRVKDNGIGCAVCEDNSEDSEGGPERRSGVDSTQLGHGLTYAADRIEGLGGRFVADGAPGEGTCVNMHIPLGARS